MYYTVCIAQCMTPSDDLLDNLRLELRRGSLILAVMAQLRSEQYGYILRKSLTDLGLDIDENTLYPLLRALETQGLLSSVWREQDKRNKRFYKLSPVGETVFERLRVEWQQLNESLNRVMDNELAGSTGV